MRANLSLNPQPLGCHAPLYAGHPVIPAREVEVKPCQIGRSVITGSSAYADDDDRGYGNRLKLAPMGTPPRIAQVQSGLGLRLLPLDPGGDHRLRPQVEVSGNARRELVGRIAERIGTQAC
jgi:hypothetical protein